jgi:hypothetical protein
MSTLVWLLFAALYLVLFVTLAMTTLRKGHTAMFWFGIIFPVLWLVGAVMAPTPRVAGGSAG